MEKENEVFFGTLFIILLIIMVLLAVNVLTGNGKSTIIISNSYDTYSNKIPSQHISYNKYPAVKNYNHNSGIQHDKNYLRYNSKSKYNYERGVFGNEINDYKVYLENKEHKPGYFTVKFYLADYDGNTRIESVTHYLKPFEGKTFRYKNVFNDEYNYAWNYKIISHAKISNSEYYPRYRY